MTTKPTTKPETCHPKICSCIQGPEWSGSPSPHDPDGEWICDGCGRTIEARSATEAPE